MDTTVQSEADDTAASGSVAINAWVKAGDWHEGQDPKRMRAHHAISAPVLLMRSFYNLNKARAAAICNNI